MKQLQGQKFMNLKSVVTYAACVVGDYLLDNVSVDEPALQTPCVEQDVFDVLGQRVSIPNPKVGVFVSAQENTFEAQRRKCMVNPGEPLWHAVVVRVFSLEGELE